jgi:hypothetical protein
VLENFDLKYPYKKKSDALKSGERGKHGISLFREIMQPENKVFIAFIENVALKLIVVLTY